MSKEQRFSFGYLPEVTGRFFQKTAEQDLLKKWSMLDGLKVQGYYFDQQLKPYLLDDFLRDFFGSDEVATTLLRIDSYQKFSPIDVKMESVLYEKLSCSLTTIELFDRLTSIGSKVARSSGHIYKCMPEYFIPNTDIHDDGYPLEIGDELRKMLIQEFLNSVNTSDSLEDEELQNLYTEDEKNEFLFRIFRHLVLGGSLCQYEDKIWNYVELAKSLYKSLLSISKRVASSEPRISSRFSEESEEEFEKNKSFEKITINSIVIGVSCAKNESYSTENFLFSRKHVNNFLYLVVDPKSKTVYTVYHHIL